jgi:AFG3 family protein
MVVYYGFNDKLGNISYYDSTNQRDLSIQKPFSEATGELIDQEIRKLVDEAYLTAKTLLTENKILLEKVAESLLKNEVIYREDLEKILGHRTKEDKILNVL